MHSCFGPQRREGQAALCCVERVAMRSGAELGRYMLRGRWRATSAMASIQAPLA